MSKLVAPVPQSDPSVPEGRYRIATVAELTGVPEPTLRAWERRYGVPAPERTASRYRLYGEEDIRLVREMRRLCGEGLAAAEAAKLLRARASAPAADAAPVDPAKDAFVLATESILDAVDRFDDVALERALRRAVFLGSATAVVERVFTPVLRTVGELWHAGELSVAQEHLASHALGAVQHDLLRLLAGDESRAPALLACFADEDHELGLLALALRLTELGMRPLFLGARTPPAALRSAVEAVSPELVALSVTVPPPKARARELVDEYASACDGVRWIVGGAGAAELESLVTKRGGVVIVGANRDLAAQLSTILPSGAGAKAGRR